MSIGLLGKKLGMTRVYDEKGVVTPVTVIAAGGNSILQVKTKETDGYEAVQVGFDEQKTHRMSKAALGHLKKSGATPKRFIREFRMDGEVEGVAVGGLPLSTFEVGQWVDVVGQSKGKGFQGVMKRHNFHGQPQTHGHMMHRRTGAIGNRSTPGRVWKNQKMPGHMGDERVTVQNLRIVQIREEDGAILVSGPVPGAKGTYVMIRPSVKKPLPKK